MGSANAVTEIDQALRFWQARKLVLDYLRSARDADGERKSIIGKLESLEGMGSERIVQMLPLLPLPLASVVALPGQSVRVEVAAANDAASTAYWLSLPFEYHQDHSYPMIVALHHEQGMVD